ncbi:OmpA family protein [Spirillospora sp. CA-294931]|uniref:OmpA family protein n=1 Tax=Spirillospora sp. CA-294931 TaxID=3240042 RepID=UPI003D8D8CF0
MKRGHVQVCAGVAAFILALGGCSDGKKNDDPKVKSGKQPTSSGPGKPPSTGRTAPMALKIGAAHMELIALNRTSPQAVTGRFRVVNEGKSPLDLKTALGYAGASGIGTPNPLPATGIGLIDGRNNKVYMPLETGYNTCLCSDTYRRPIPVGGDLDIYAAFPAPPNDVKNVTVVMPSAVPFQDVPLGNGPVQPVSGQLDPAKVKLKPPRILDLTSIAEGDEQSVDEDAKDREVRLSSDVLFNLNKADLTPNAERLLQQVGKQIDASTGAEVKVDGHADNSGNDAINQPLSERRAQTVADRLKGLVARQGVTYKPAGHGSKQPVAPNSDEGGRRKNRRVTITFARPVPPPVPSSGNPYQGKEGVLGSAGFTSPAAKDLKVEVNSLHRDSAGLTTLVWTMRNTGTAKVDFRTKFEKSYVLHGGQPPRRGPSMGGVMLYDPTSKMRFEPLFAASQACMCSSLSGDETKDSIGPGESVIYWGVFKVAPEAQAVEVQYPWDKAKDAVVSGLSIK